MAFRKTLKKFARKAYKKVIRPYTNKKKGRTNRMKLYQEVSAIKKMVNAEKKQKDIQYTGQSIGQLLNGSEGAQIFTLIPSIAQGAGYDQRNGRSLKMSGLFIRGQFYQQTNTNNRMKINCMIIKVVGTPVVTSTILTNLFNTDSISGVRDYFAPRNPDAFTDFRIIASKNFTLLPDNISGQTGNVDFLWPLKLSHHVRYDLNTSSITEGELFMIIRADRGDSGTPATGAWYQMTIRATYFDN